VRVMARPPNLRGTMQKVKIINYDKDFLYGGN